MTLYDNPADLLNAIADLIEQNPQRWNQGTWFLGRGQGGEFVQDPPAVDIQGQGIHCGTAGCVAGWAVALSSRPINQFASYQDAGREALNLSDGAADVLFSSVACNEDLEAMVWVLRQLALLSSDAPVDETTVFRLIEEALR